MCNPFISCWMDSLHFNIVVRWDNVIVWKLNIIHAWSLTILSNYMLYPNILQYLAIEAILRPPKIMIRYKKMKFTIFWENSCQGCFWFNVTFHLRHPLSSMYSFWIFLIKPYNMHENKKRLVCRETRICTSSDEEYFE